ncbi:MAG: DEAD/DEAH box helicase [Tannerella sp.]|jgi:superfamily II DNA or RNA helicase|nr:DEAD/DEAH box helicase [Tannerella sp.]
MVATDQLFFAVIIHEHRFFGWLFSAHLMTVDPESGLLSSVGRLQPESFRQYNYPYSDAEINIVKITGNYSDNKLLNMFKRRVRSLPEFFKLAEMDREVGDYVRDYIERMMLKVFDVVSAGKIPAYLKEENFDYISGTRRLEFVPEAAGAVFEYELADNELRYRLSVTCGGDDKNLNLLHAQIICIDPCLLRIKNKVYKVSSIDGKKLLPFLSKRFITVQGAAVKKYMETFVLNSIYSQKVIAKGFCIEKQQEKNRQAVLSIEERFSGGWAFFLRLRYGDKDFIYDSLPNVKVSLEEKDGNYYFYRFERDMKWEERQFDTLLQLGLIRYTADSEFIPATGYDKNIYSLIWWVNDNIDVLRDRNITVEQRNGKTPYYMNGSSLNLLGDQKEDWFDIYGKVKLADYEIPFLHFRLNIMNGDREFILPDKRVFVIPDSWFTRYKSLFILSKVSGNKLRLPRVFFNFMDDAGIKSPTVDELRRRFSTSHTDGIAMPAGLKASLRNYQKEGLLWLKMLHINRIGGCLADDMGLGKTLQALAFFQMLKEEESVIRPSEPELSNRSGEPELPGERSVSVQSDRPGSVRSKTNLIIVPTSLVHNWLREIERFTPEMQVCLFTGQQRTRDMETLMQYDMVITTYGIVRNDIDMLKDVVFNYVVLDESQIIKNPDSKIYHSVLLLRAAGFLALCGTPIENSLMDLWAQLNFLNRGVLGSRKSFREEFVVPIEKDDDRKKGLLLKKMIEPLVLRRKKDDVAKDLPAITEQIVYCEMTDSQSDIYEREKSVVRNSILENIDKQGFGQSAISILRGLTRLRQIANHPLMIYTENPSSEIGVDATTDGSGEIALDSGKFEEIVRSLENIISEGHKVLVFSSFVKHLNLVAAYLEKTGVEYLTLTGRTVNRKEIVDKFQQDENIPVFLISIKAGGVGLNLTAADYIFILDPWWNPAVENQAVSRAHRIGQDKHIFVYRFIAVGTVEEKIVRLQERKELLSKDFTESINPLRLLGKQNIIDLLN